MGNKGKSVEFSSQKRLVGIAIGGMSALALATFLFLDWRIKDICKWSHLAEVPANKFNFLDLQMEHLPYLFCSGLQRLQQ